MPDIYNIDGIAVDLINPDLGAGGQGRAEQVALSSDLSIGLVAKHLPMDEDVQKRTKYLVEQSLPLLSPFLAAPIAANLGGGGEIVHLAPLALGHNLLSDARTFPENMEIAYHFACLTTILEEHGLAHGDIAPSNIMIATNGAVYLIDFDNFASIDPNVPPPTMAGQHEMMAPEIRDKSGHIPNINSDRFSYGTIYNILLMRRHPADEANVPAEFDIIMSSGLWPERQLIRGADDIPIEALGRILPILFDEACSLDPDQRPSADEWRRALGEALHNLMIHDCGHAFVLSAGQQDCPHCGISIQGEISPLIRQLKITVPSIQARYRLELNEGQAIILGRSNLGGAFNSVSARHLEITPLGKRLFLRHIGRHPTQILKDGKWFNLQETWIELDDILNAPITLKLADVHIDIGV